MAQGMGSAFVAYDRLVYGILALKQRKQQRPSCYMII